jgi:hypothetical protein
VVLTDMDKQQFISNFGYDANSGTCVLRKDKKDCND